MCDLVMLRSVIYENPNINAIQNSLTRAPHATITPHPWLSYENTNMKAIHNNDL